jgi:uncharacterized cupredoxin-like copper-binding protein
MFVVVGVIGVLAIFYLTVFAVGPISQTPPSKSLLAGFRAEGIIPANVNLEEDETAEEAEVFDIPPEDAVMLEQILAGTMSMPGMDMSGMDMSGMDMSAMKMDGDGAMKMPMDGDGQTMDMSAMKIDGDGDGEIHMEEDDDDAGHMGGNGIEIAYKGEFDREIKLTMAGWKFSKMMIDVNRGERIKFTVTNGDQLPHEFMFMDMPLMSAVDYRIKRADWNLLEHEALYEKALGLPGGEFSFVLTVTQPGSWMFMCMLPYHMEMGMTGEMATEGMFMMNMQM